MRLISNLILQYWYQTLLLGEGGPAGNEILNFPYSTGIFNKDVRPYAEPA